MSIIPELRCGVGHLPLFCWPVAASVDRHVMEMLAAWVAAGGRPRCSIW